MKRRLLSICCALMLMAGLTMISVVDSHASEEPRIVDGSRLTHDDESIGYDTKITRGEDLLIGYSKCVDMGPGKLYAGGVTIAAHVVKEVSVAVNVERLEKVEGEEEEKWVGTGYGWQEFLEDTDRVNSNRVLDVEGGYYYRVCCTHSANSDVSTSFTDGIYIEKKPGILGD